MAVHRAIVLVRGINVGSNRKVPMAQLRALCEAAGCSGVRTYIQSGNVVLDTSMSDSDLAEAVADGIEAGFGFRVAVMVRRLSELRRVLDSRPFGDVDEGLVHVGFLGAKPTAAALSGLQGVDFAPERFAVSGKQLFLYLPNGLGHSKMMRSVPFERRLGVDVTMRNWRTVTALYNLAKDA